MLQHSLQEPCTLLKQQQTRVILLKENTGRVEGIVRQSLSRSLVPFSMQHVAFSPAGPRPSRLLALEPSAPHFYFPCWFPGRLMLTALYHFYNDTIPGRTISRQRCLKRRCQAGIAKWDWLSASSSQSSALQSLCHNL